MNALRTISTCPDRDQYSQKDLDELREKLNKVKTTMQDGQLTGDDGVVGPGQDLVVPLLNRCLKFTELVEERCVTCKVV